MALFIPEIVVFRIVEAAFNLAKRDWEANSATEEKTVLYKLFYGQKYELWDYYEQAKSLFLRKMGDAREIKTRMFFDVSRASIPTVHITLPGETSQYNSLGIGQGDNASEFDDVREEVTPTLSRNYKTTFHIIITSDNTIETLLIYHFLKNIITSMLDHVQFEGIQNPILSGNDIRIDSSIVPGHIFARALALDFFYETVTPRYFSSKVISDVIFNGVPTNGSLVINP